MKCYISLFARITTFFVENSTVIGTMSRKAASSSKGPWFHGLLSSMEDPELKVMEDDEIVVIKDKYPKAQFHYLVIPKEDIPGIRNVENKNAELLAHMEKVGKNIMEQHKNHEFMYSERLFISEMGYHAVPSLYRLHLHVVSTDFDSPCLKNKFHWNSFTTPFFLRSEDVGKQLEEHEKVLFESDEEYNSYLVRELQCHKCSTRPRNMPQLKRHILTHKNEKRD